MAANSADQPQEEGWLAASFERKYYKRDGAFIKRSLRPSEFKVGFRGRHVPRLGKERLKNEAESLEYIRKHTDIPVPKVYCHFEDDQAYYLITEYVEGEGMSDLTEEQKAVVQVELEIHLAKLKALKSSKLGGPSSLVVPPHQALERTTKDIWDFQAATSLAEYVFCHNDLSQHNVIVDPDTLKIQAIIDWEYACFYSPRFEFPFYHRLGPSAAINDEVDDSLELLELCEPRIERSCDALFAVAVTI